MGVSFRLRPSHSLLVGFYFGPSALVFTPLGLILPLRVTSGLRPRLSPIRTNQAFGPRVPPQFGLILSIRVTSALARAFGPRNSI